LDSNLFWVLVVSALAPHLAPQAWTAGNGWLLLGWKWAVAHPIGKWTTPITSVVTLATGVVVARFNALPLAFCITVLTLFVLVQAYGVERRAFDQKREAARFILDIGTEIGKKTAKQSEQAALRAETAVADSERRILAGLASIARAISNL
jgi:hypothetical protein